MTMGTPPEWFTTRTVAAAKPATLNPAPKHGTVVIYTADIAVGDKVTECKYPEGPYYLVTKVNKASYVVHVTDQGEPFSARVPLTTGIIRKVA